MWGVVYDSRGVERASVRVFTEVDTAYSTVTYVMHIPNTRSWQCQRSE